MSSPLLTVRVKGWPAGLEPASPGSRPRNVCLYTTATAGTAGLEPAASRLTSERSDRLSYAPIDSRADGIRTRGLELMRLARTTAPLPRKEQHSGGRDRTCDLAGNNRASFQLDHTGLGQAEAEGGGSRTRTCERLWPPAR